MTLVPKTIPVMVFGTRVFKWTVYGPFVFVCVCVCSVVLAPKRGKIQRRKGNWVAVQELKFIPYSDTILFSIDPYYGSLN